MPVFLLENRHDHLVAVRVQRLGEARVFDRILPRTEIDIERHFTGARFEQPIKQFGMARPRQGPHALLRQGDGIDLNDDDLTGGVALQQAKAKIDEMPLGEVEQAAQIHRGDHGKDQQVFGQKFHLVPLSTLFLKSLINLINSLPRT